MKKLKLVYSLIGTFFISFAVSFFRLADFGTDPYTTFNLGASGFLNIGFGLFIMITSLIALILIYFDNRALVGIGTLFNIFIVGNFSDITVNLYNSYFTSPDGLLIRIIFSILGLFFISSGVALYTEAKEGVAPYDAFPIILTEKANGRWTYGTSRVIIDVSFSIIGFLFGATLGVNTLITAFLLGPIIQFFRKIFQKDLETRMLRYSTKK
ncbi:YczE/YyaS/YitT family protein [Alkalibacterium olivapovliticus]|uniref:Membrane protein YczE n=1 Tax=Alkalibacterium olivapovliticus TaxID=99907 RepID=A0A2T0W7Q4_9LACT|nr:membrane protein [Alkalibacterium olivapovliticus]PRY82737.1 hypothetical protein CLV38_10967 [Alkalibacterium olivapovliticus]